VRNGVENLGRELQRRAISRQAQWGASGIVFVFLELWSVEHLTSEQNIHAERNRHDALDGPSTKADLFRRRQHPD
jgi:hypothetical protein